MRLVNLKYGIDITFKEETIEVLVLENEKIRRELIEELWCQTLGEAGNFVLSEDKILKIEKKVEMIINPFSLSFQDRKIISALYSKMSVIGNEYIEEKNDINSRMVTLLEKISNQINYSGIVFNLEFSWMDLFKTYGVKIDTQEDFLCKIVEYMKVFYELCEVRIFCFVDLKKYLQQEEFLEFYKCIQYNKLKVILIESQEGAKYEFENITIIDKDNCVIRK